ncbi:phosphotransferase [Nocardioides sp. KC13]|uniref:Phosphotransferase n=1 Tax=Nocardioides turkmenicus TaxID=2711220 RepID=A0A6M1R9W8_9ACTN|nr:phosphotransferase [Nocardioides sp. KC13]NGN94279.1 phosphotransferase [Nocardioides sp. KC13]
MSGSATRDGQRVWVRTVTEQPQWAEAPFWVGNTEANKILGVPKPIVLDSTEIRDEERWFRTEVMTLVDQAPASPVPAATAPPAIDDVWLDQLRTSLDALATVSTTRQTKDQDDVTQQLREYFGDRIHPQVERWVASHGDLHWANLTAPTLVILDWEQWGLAPSGYDIATLYCHSLLLPETAATIRHRFTHVLDSPDGRRAQLLAIARMLSRTRMGDYTDLVIPLHRLADEILGR